MEMLNRFTRKVITFMGSPLARRLVLALFVAQAVFLVFNIKIGVPPDEANHIHFIRFYAENSLSPIFTDQEPTYNLGDKTREVDYLYHYLMSLVYRILPLSTEGIYTTIRLFSVLFGLSAFLVLGRVLKLLGLSAAVITTAFLIATNLPMVLMMSSAINNDALVWLGMALGLLLTIRLWQKPAALDLLGLIGLALIGGLVKITFLPLALFFGLVGLLILVKNFQTITSGLRRFNWSVGAATLLVIIAFGLFAERVGGNVVQYGNINVSCEQVHGEDACHDFWVNVRARSLAERTPEPPVALPEFVVRWFDESIDNNINVQTQGWRHEVKPAPWLTPFLMALLFTGLAYGVVYEKKRFSKEQKSKLRTFALLAAFYFILVHLVFNYGVYKRTEVFGIALNGRYILPSLLPLIGLTVFYFSKLLKGYPRILVILAIFIVLALFVESGLSLMLRNPQIYTG